MTEQTLPSCRACGGRLKVPQTQICLDCGDADDHISERAETVMLASVVALVMVLSTGAIWLMS